MQAPQVPLINTGRRIPRVIHQTVSDASMLTPEIRTNIDTITARNPGWDYRLYDDRDRQTFIRDYYGRDFLRIYQRINPAYGACRADFFRYLLIYAIGGVYLDLKSTTTRPLDDVVPHDCQYILSKWDNGPGGTHAGWGMDPMLDHLPGGEYQQWHVMAAAGHPILKRVIDRVMANIRNYKKHRKTIGKRGVLRLTGPVAYSLAVADAIAYDAPLPGVTELEVTPDMGVEYSIYTPAAGSQPRAGDPQHKATHKKKLGTHYSELKSAIVKPASLSDYLAIIRHRISQI